MQEPTTKVSQVLTISTKVGVFRQANKGFDHRWTYADVVLGRPINFDQSIGFVLSMIRGYSK